MDVVTRVGRAEADLDAQRGDLLRLVRGPAAVRRWAVASLVANVGIIVTGALVRLTGSGLGCPTWPRCTSSSYVAHPALGYHGAIEFGNRLLTFVLVVVAVLTWASAMFARDQRGGGTGRRRDLRWLAGGLALGIPVQAVIGGISVLHRLNPYIVGLHLVVSMALVGLSVWLVRRTRPVVLTAAPGWAVWLARAAFLGMTAAVLVGTLVTGSGPHAGDEHVARNALDGAVVTTVHATLVYATVALTAATLLVLRNRPALLLLAVEVLQAAVGITQYHLGLPIGLVALHLLGAGLAVAAATNLLLSVRRAASTA